MAATVWKGYITFGLISVPVRLFTAARSDRISFNQLHEKCHTRVKQQLYCPTCDCTVERSELVKGYAYTKDQYILVEDAEIKKVQPESAGGMEILEFVKLDEVDPLYFDSSYYIVPEEAGQKAYQLLVETMDKAGYAAIAKLAMHQREYTVLVRARKKGLTLHTMYYPNEIRELSDYGKGTPIEVKPQELQLAQQLVESLATAFEPTKYHDQYQARLKELIEDKRAGEETTANEGPKLAPVIDLMEALQKSLKAKPAKKAPARATEADVESAAAEKPRASRRRTPKAS
jgi:DNA end-binding protein Ku